MEREALKNLSAKRRNHVEVEAPARKKVIWNCQYCEHDFATETGFMNHRCKERARMDELRSPVGQAAYSYYAEWMKLNKRSVPPIETFAASTLYSTFIKFANHAVKVRLPNVMGFIRAMVENGKVQPSLWCRDNVYAMYLQGYDKVVSPTQQFFDSYEEIDALSMELKCAHSQVFEQIGVDTVLDLVQKRKLSAWFLVSSGAFRSWLNSRRPDDLMRLEDAIQVGALLARISHDKQLMALLTDFSKAAKELDL